MSDSLTLALLLTAAAAVGCSKPALEISRLDPRDGGGVIVSGVRPSYDGLAEKDTSTFERVSIDDDGHVRSDDDLAGLTGVPAGVGLLDFADGSHLELMRPTGDQSQTSPQTVQRIDGQGNELWLRALPISYVVASTTDGASAFVLGGEPLQPTDGALISGFILVKLTEDGDLGWTSHLQ